LKGQIEVEEQTPFVGERARCADEIMFEFKQVSNLVERETSNKAREGMQNLEDRRDFAFARVPAGLRKQVITANLCAIWRTKADEFTQPKRG
jgi:hypothetical protein